ncbi:ATP-dependent OLD family endonuclease (plasmid) [Paenibacillus larvae subsp. larvae]|uniref:ATP-dependent OLD family endonuclease n=1 Tax=Paenibacillus larvae subsp. larvae TaxID=147375 RepID=A0A2L1UKD2_9BACL|nr:AAA family ATPase [Paenibacillus larvae]AQT87049.1 ATP-dependent endonuclease [Paenibacillus larvae subsp. pulvifaciens]AQZ49367.1 ATP-dependent endonuclease [Paenibacillus larvae subsp. pulvifaciens]AVF29014.1 ATP-dependent OLD family endonuclease [Paenibacillus larvae subsp. larvae]AVF33395.1 ATP-dependent OLD family endonuclease [Paenibacillus larvae subsp. larvae]MBH0343897.1 ATP-dependent endonuclease [Paenibacillus larvae]
MAKGKQANEVILESTDPTIPRPRLSKLIVKNFRCIGSTPVEIELDHIVILVGPNNAGKSSILRAYEVVMSHGSNACKLTLHDFPNGKIDLNAFPEIELQTVLYDDTPGKKWIQVDETTGEKYVREKWFWKNVGLPERQGFDVEEGKWVESVPWGAPNVANTKRPQPHKVDAFANPDEQAKDIIKILMSVLEERIKTFKSRSNIDNTEEESEFELLLNQIEQIQTKIIQESQQEISNVENEISTILDRVFPGYKVKFDARPQDDLEKTISLFKADPQLLMGPESGYQSTIDRQGSGARRTLLWAALRFISESQLGKKSKITQRPHVLLLDEPELCLHPNAIREACRVLYSLPESSNWQVMITTHSPSFIDLSRDNTTIIRVERNQNGEINGTTLFRPSRTNLDDDDKKRLKLLNLCDPYVAEFFFGGRIIIVEGDTEYTAFKYVIDSHPKDFKDVHIIRARGKATIVSLIKILNHFGSSYSILHDSDKPHTNKLKENGEQKKNAAWSINKKIGDTVRMHTNPDKVRLLASIPNFEEAYLQAEVKDEKPYNALMNIRENPHAFDKIASLLRALVDHTVEVPEGCKEWKTEDDLKKAVLSLETIGVG